MKKLWIPLGIVACLAVFCAGFLLAGMTSGRPFDDLPQGSDLAPPAQPADSITVLQEGTFPGLSDVPVTAEQAAPGRKVMYALREQKYTWILPFLRPRDGGISIYKLRSCTPECIAYWDGSHLWLYNRPKDLWQGYRPISPDKLDETLQSFCS